MTAAFVFLALALLGHLSAEPHRHHSKKDDPHRPPQHHLSPPTEQGPLPPPPHPSADATPCGVCVREAALFFEDALYYMATHARNSPQTQALLVESEDAFCRHEVKLHDEWMAHTNVETFMTWCSHAYGALSHSLADPQHHNAPADPYAYAKESCTRKGVCSDPHAHSPAHHRSSRNDCESCLRMRTLFAEDEKYFFSFLNRMDDPKSAETAQAFCMMEAKLHMDWVTSGHVDAFMDGCHREYQHVLHDAHTPRDIRPYEYAKYDCEMHKFCGVDGGVTETSKNPIRPPPPPPVDTDYPPPPFDTDLPPPPPFDPKHPPPPPPFDTDLPPPPPFDPKHPPPPPPFDTDLPPPPFDTDLPPPPFDPKHPPPPPFDTDLPPPPFDSDFPPPPPQGHDSGSHLPFGLDSLFKQN